MWSPCNRLCNVTSGLDPVPPSPPEPLPLDRFPLGDDFDPLPPARVVVAVGSDGGVLVVDDFVSAFDAAAPMPARTKISPLRKSPVAAS
jgi:hypothetical protein